MSVRLGLVLLVLLVAAPAYAGDSAKRAQELIDVARFDDAWDEIERGLAANPADRDLLSMRAMLDLIRDELPSALYDTARAVVLGVPEADLQIVDLVVAARNRREQHGSTLPAGSAARFVDEWIEALAAGRPADELATAFDPSWWADAKVKSHDTVARVLAAEIAKVRAAERADDIHRGGWIVQPKERQLADRVWVHVESPTVLEFTRSVRNRYAEVLARGETGALTIDLELLDSLRRAPPDSRARTLDGLIGKHFWTSTRYHVELVADGDGWRITDILADRISYRKGFADREALLGAPPTTAGEQRVRHIGMIFLAFAAGGGLFVGFRRLRVRA